MGIQTIVIPYMPRTDQVKLSKLRALFRFYVANIHRRFGKTVWAVNELISDVLRCTLANPRGAYIAPYRSQAKIVAWEFLNHYTSTIPGMKDNDLAGATGHCLCQAANGLPDFIATGVSGGS